MEVSGYVFTGFFTLEYLLKVLAMGFISHKNSYLRDGWNWIDFVVVIIGLIEIIPGIPTFRGLRTLRVLRPLRSVKTVPSMRRLLASLLMSLPKIGNVAFFLIFLFALFGILGVQQYSGEFYWRCRYDPAPVNGSWPYDPSVDRLCSSGYGDYDCPGNLTCGNPS